MESKMSNTIKKFRLGELFCGLRFRQNGFMLIIIVLAACMTAQYFLQ